MDDGNLAARLDEDSHHEADLTDERLAASEEAFGGIYRDDVDLLANGPAFRSWAFCPFHD